MRNWSWLVNICRNRGIEASELRCEVDFAIHSMMYPANQPVSRLGGPGRPFHVRGHSGRFHVDVRVGSSHRECLMIGRTFRYLGFGEDLEW